MTLGALFFVFAILFLVSCKHATSNSPFVRLNQVGYAPEQEKTATILVHKENSQPYKVNIHTADNRVNVWLTASEEMRNPVSGKLCQIVDFSQITEPGEYTMDVLLVPEPIWYEPTGC